MSNSNVPNSYTPSLPDGMKIDDIKANSPKPTFEYHLDELLWEYWHINAILNYFCGGWWKREFAHEHEPGEQYAEHRECVKSLFETRDQIRIECYKIEHFRSLLKQQDSL